MSWVLGLKGVNFWESSEQVLLISYMQFSNWDFSSFVPVCVSKWKEIKL
jgi:hypothetical protein